MHILESVVNSSIDLVAKSCNENLDLGSLRRRLMFDVAGSFLLLGILVTGGHVVVLRAVLLSGVSLDTKGARFLAILSKL